MAELVTSDMRDAAKKICEGAKDLKSAAVERASTAAEQGSDALASFCDATEDKIVQNPYKSVLIAFGVGALVGVIMSKR